MEATKTSWKDLDVCDEHYDHHKTSDRWFEILRVGFYLSATGQAEKGLGENFFCTLEELEEQGAEAARQKTTLLLERGIDWTGFEQGYDRSSEINRYYIESHSNWMDFDAVVAKMDSDANWRSFRQTCNQLGSKYLRTVPGDR